MNNITASYQLDNGLKILKEITPREAVQLIRTGRYRDHYADTAAIFDKQGNLKGERRADLDPGAPVDYGHWWHDDDLTQQDFFEPPPKNPE